MSSIKSGSSEDEPRTRSATDAAPTDEGSATLPVVALGTSAGGLAACTTFLQNVAVDTGFAFVVVQHLDPHHDSMLVDLLGKATSMPVVQIQDGMALARDRVHVIPPDTALTLGGQHLRLLPRDNARTPMPIDGFLRALAEDRGHRAIAVILSGTGTDGSLGVQAIREHGGVTLAQTPADAAFDGMPNSAIATGCIDLVCPAAQLGAEVARIAKEPALTREPPAAPQGRSLAEQTAWSEVIALLRTATGIDFSRYRLTTVGRRLDRRLMLRGVPLLRDYVDYLRANPSELQELAQDLLISVTRFFRDPDVFAFLAQTAFPDLIRRAAADGVVRIWVPGCSTGEEAYSLAITFVETAQRMHSPVTCQLFATDINESVLEKARRATYLDNIAIDVCPERLQRYFAPTNGSFRLDRSIRDLCVFSRHDLLSDPPLSRMDMVSCRNLLIYLDSSHRPALQAIHFALEPHGYLLLGRSETAAASPDLFEVVDKDIRLFRSLDSVTGRTFPRSLGARDARRRASPSPVPDPGTDAAAYEELIAANEELQSLNEELESSKEEIESTNEELQTLNQELRSRNTALHVAHKFSAATLDTVQSGLLVLDRNHVVVNANRSFYRAFQLTPAEVERRRIGEVAPDYFASPNVAQLLEQARTSSTPREDVEIAFDLPGRGHRVLVFNLRRFSPGDLLLLSVTDVTQLRQMEADRRQSQKMEAIGHLAAGVAHDFNNLLTVVLAGSQLALQGMAQDSPIRSTIESVGAAALRAADLTRQLLAYAGKGRVYVERVALSDIAAQAANLLHASIPTHVQLRLDLDRDLPRLLADPSQMHQVIDNLLKNAIEAIGDKSGTVLVRTGQLVARLNEIDGTEPGTKLPPGEYVFVEINDTGVGMTVDTQRQMFDPFFTTKFTGRGLGLAAVQGIVRQHHGTITVNSVPGRGTTIRVLLATGVALPAPLASVALPSLRRGTETVLVVDDEPLVLSTMQTALTTYGYQVLTATGGGKALELLRANPAIAAIVLDATMPGLNGVETLQGIRTIAADIPVLVSSGLGDAAVEAAFGRHVIKGYLHKPYTVRQLIELIATCFPAAK